MTGTGAMLIGPVLIPMFTGIVVMLLRRRRTAARVASITGSLLLAACTAGLALQVFGAGVQSVAFGAWPGPYGIVFVADPLAALMLNVAALIGLAGTIYALADIDVDRESLGHNAFIHWMLMGICGAFLTGDLFNLYVWFEVMLIASFVLMSLGGGRLQHTAAVKYVTLNLVSSGLFLAALGLLYGKLGTLNMADLAVKLPQTIGRGSDTALLSAGLFFVAFGIKAAVFPLFFWLPASYHVPPVTVSAIFAGLLTKVGVYAMFRVGTLLFPLALGSPEQILMVVFASTTMVFGVLGAIAQTHIRRLLSFHIISQIGYMLIGMAIMTPLALAAAIFYMIHHIIVKANLFFVAGLAKRYTDSERLEEMGGLFGRAPWLGALFLIPALSLAGLPPLSGFFAKLGVIKGALAVEAYGLAAVALFVGLLTLSSMVKVWTAAFWKPLPEDRRYNDGPVPVALWLPIVLLATITVSIGLAPQGLFAAATAAAELLLAPQPYLDAVLGGTP